MTTGHDALKSQEVYVLSATNTTPYSATLGGYWEDLYPAVSAGGVRGVRGE